MNAVLHEITSTPASRDRSVVTSSVIPPAKYCCSGALLRLETADELGVDADVITRLTHASLEHLADPCSGTPGSAVDAVTQAPPDNAPKPMKLPSAYRQNEASNVEVTGALAPA